MIKEKQGISVAQKFATIAGKKRLVGVVVDNKDYAYTLLFKDKMQLASLFVSDNKTGQRVVTLTPDSIPAKTPGKQGNASFKTYVNNVYVFPGTRIGETDMFAVEIPSVISPINGIGIKTDTRTITLMQKNENASFTWDAKGVKRVKYRGMLGHEMMSPVVVDGVVHSPEPDQVEMYRLAIIGAIQKSADIQKLKALKALAESKDEAKITFVSALFGMHKSQKGE